MMSKYKKLAKDLFGGKKEFQVSQRTEDGKIRDFKLKNSDLDSYFGSLFIKK